jgi:hypothetical protein
MKRRLTRREHAELAPWLAAWDAERDAMALRVRGGRAVRLGIAVGNRIQDLRVALNGYAESGEAYFPPEPPWSLPEPPPSGLRRWRGSMTLEDHLIAGVRIKRMATFFLCLHARLIDAYPQKSAPVRAARRLDRAIRLWRNHLDDKVGKQFPPGTVADEIVLGCYYGGAQAR